MSSRLSRPVALAMLALCTGCASIVSGTNQSLSVTSAAPSGDDLVGARCTLVNDKGSWYATTPGSVTVHRSYGDLAVSCTHDAFEPGTTAVKSSTKGMAAGNLLFGGLVGVGVDVSTGAAYDYPTLVRVTMGAPVGGAAVSVSPATRSAPAVAPVVPIAVPTSPATPEAPVAIGTRLSFLESDPISGGPLGETTYVVTGLEPPGVMSFNDGSIVVGADGSPLKGALHGAVVYGLAKDRLARGGSWSGKFRAPPVVADVPAQLTVIGNEVRVVSGRRFEAVRLRVEGYASRENVTAIGSAGGSVFKGEMLVDPRSGLVLELTIRSRHPSYNIRRELVRVAGT